MSKYLLDTCIVAFLFRDKYGIADKLEEVGFQNCYISEVTIAELQAGVEKSSNKYLIMVTDNVRHFEYIPNIRIENWVEG